MSRRHLAVFLLMLVVLLAGCARPSPRSNIKLALKGPAQTNPDTPPATTPEKKSHYPETPPDFTISHDGTEAGIITGQVIWAGQGDPARFAPRLVVHPEGRGIADAVIWLEKASVGTGAVGMELQLLQKENEFRPRLQVARKGAPLRLQSADERASFKASGALDFNLPLTRGKPQVRTLDRPGLVEVRSELRPEAIAFIWVFDHDHFALTDREGRFRLPAVPPGEYTLMLWHEDWRAADPAQPGTPLRKQGTVKISEGRGAGIQWKVGD